MALQDVLQGRNSLARGSGKIPLLGGSGGAGFSTGPTPPVEVDVAIIIQATRTTDDGLIYLPFGSSAVTSTGVTAVESEAQFRATRNGTLKKAKLNVETNDKNTPTKVSIRVNGVTRLTVTMGVGVTGDVDIPGSTPILENDKISLQLDTTTSSVGLFALVASYEIA